MTGSQLSMVALYGAKPSTLVRFISYTRQESLYYSDHFVFQPYPVAQVHATIIGMERLPFDEELINQNIFNTKKTKEVMQFSKLKSVLRKFLPMEIQIGGFGENDTSFLSNEKKPFERTLFFDPNTRKLVLIGWPHADGDFSERRLWKLRSGLEEQCNIGHKYPDDNDFYMVLGDLKAAGEATDEIFRFIHHMQNYLSENPLFLGVRMDSLSIAVYNSTRLDADSSVIHPLKPLLSSHDAIADLYH